MNAGKNRRTTMQDRRLDGIRVAILVTTDFEQVEMTEPRKALDRAGATTTLISTQQGQTQGFNHDKAGDTFTVDMTLDQANPSDFDAVLLPGGALNADNLRMQPKAQAFVKQFDQAKRPIASICHAPWLLVSAGLIRGRKLTSYHTIQNDIKNAGGAWLDQELVRDGNWVTSRSPKDLPAFNRGMIELFSESASGGSRNGNGHMAATGARQRETH
jgi:protease I